YRQSVGITEAHFELGPAAGVALSGSGLGFGGGASGFFMLDSTFGFGGILRLYLFNQTTVEKESYIVFSTQGIETVTTNDSDSSLEFVPAIKLKLGGNPLEPYLLAGAGLASLSAAETTAYSYSNGLPAGVNPNPGFSYSGSKIFPVLALGIGLELKLDPNLRLFLETRGDLILGTYGSSTLLPLEGGVNFNL
ncbi:MAG: hypothetical protein ACRD4E_09140, partial [Bryobacteraceae bacterium]